MSNTTITRKSIQPGSDGAFAIPVELSCVFKFGKDHQYDQYIKHELLDELETDELSKVQSDNITLTTAAYDAAIMSIKNQLKLSSSLQVHSSDGSLISVFNTEAVPSTSTTYTNLEPSIDLPNFDPSFIQQLLENPDLDLSTDFDTDLSFTDLFDNTDPFDSNMIQEVTNVPMEATLEYSEPEYSSSLAAISGNDETSISSVSSQQSEENIRDDVNRRGIKKGGGPVRKMARFGNKQVIKYSEDYHDRRIKNNEAVKKSRMKAKEKQKSSESQMSKLSEENRLLSDRVDSLMKELQLLRSLYKELKHDLPTESAQTVQRINTH